MTTSVHQLWNIETRCDRRPAAHGEIVLHHDSEPERFRGGTRIVLEMRFKPIRKRIYPVNIAMGQSPN